MYKRGKTWMCVVTLGIKDGKQIRATKGGFRTKKEAVDYIPKLRETSAVERFSLEHYWQIYSQNAMQKLSESRRKCYRIAWNKLEPLHEKAVSTIKVSDAQMVVNETASTYGPAHDEKIVLSTLFKLAIADQQTNINVAQYIDIPKNTAEEPRPFTDEEVARIWELYEAGDEIASYLLLMIYTGMMPAELIDCTRESIHLDERMIVGIGRKTQTRRDTPIVLSSTIVPVIENLLSLIPDNPDAHIMRLQPYQLYVRYKKWKEKHGFRDLPLYACRHTTATILASNPNIAPTTVQKVMRHANFNTTQHYIHPDMSDALDAINTISKPC